MNIKEITELLASVNEKYNKENEINEEVNSDYLDIGNILEQLYKPQTINGFKIEIEEDFGGEGQGDHAHNVLSIKDKKNNITYVKVDGFYSSYEGTNWSDGDGFYKVEPYEKTVRDWRSVK